MAKVRNYYLGIDLGTTNSSVAFVVFDAFTERPVPKVILMQMKDTPTAQPLVPSVIMYKNGESHPLEVGLGTKEKLRLGSYDPDCTVVRSVKLEMGEQRVKSAPWLTPEQVSADILRFLKAGAEKKLRYPQSSVVIGVPACFNTDMWTATKRAAEMAGFESVQLLDEPKAALLDFMHDQELLAPESRVLDFTEPKTICVFDPGGGTLDVSVVKVQQRRMIRGGRTVYAMEFEDLGLTRQPYLGGDDFDKLLADFLAERFFDQTRIRIDEIPDKQLRTFARGKLLEYAEAAKKNLTDEVENQKIFAGLTEEQAMDQAAVDVVISFLYRTYGLNYHLSYREYVEIISPLLGLNLQLSDIDNPAVQRKLEYQREYRKCENIIMPIFDALLKAKRALGYVPSIDAVLVSGGMVKLHIIRQRLRDFFGESTPIIEAPSPDLSVARGAAIHHYNIVHGLDRTSNLLPDAICLEISKGVFIPLVPAHTKYPTAKPIVPEGVEIFIPRDRIPYLDIPLWRGEPPHPTAKLIERRIKFGDKAASLSKGDIVDMQITINANRELKLEAWLRGKPEIRFEVTTAVA